MAQMKFGNLFLLLGIVALVGFSCGEGASDGDSEAEGQPQEEKSTESSTLLEIEGKLFSFPSPVQTALLIKEVGSNYDATLLNEASNVNKYSTNFKKAINLGIYGADLGYVTIYEQTQNAIAYLTAVKKMSNDLGISGAFDLSLLERFEKNLGNRDSLLALVSDAFRASDAYLKNNQRNDVGALVLAGGWVESLYFSTLVAQSTHNDEVITRIGSQKNTCNNLVKLMMPYYNKEEYTAFIDQLMELNQVYQNIDIVYTYKKPTVDAATKTTTINSETDIRITDEQLKDISGKIKIIRNQLIG